MSTQVAVSELVKSQKFPPVVLLFGEEDLLVEEAAELYIQSARSVDTAGMSTDIIDGEGQSLDSIISIARSFPMMSERRTLWVKHFDKVVARQAKRADLLSSYLEDPTPSSVVLFTASLPSAAGIGATLAKNTPTAQRKVKALKYPFNVLLTSAHWQEFPALKSSQVAAWIQKKATALGLTINPMLAEMLIAQHGTSIRMLGFELDKLATFVGEQREVTEDDIAMVVGSSRAYTVFELQRAIGQRNIKSATAIVDAMLEADRQELLIISMLARYFTTLYKLVDARALGGQQNIASAAGIPPFAVSDHLDALQRLGVQTVERALQLLRQAESLLKSSSVDPRIVLQTMLSLILASPSERITHVSLDIFAP